MTASSGATAGESPPAGAFEWTGVRFTAGVSDAGFPRSLGGVATIPGAEESTDVSLAGVSGALVPLAVLALSLT